MNRLMLQRAAGLARLGRRSLAAQAAAGVSRPAGKPAKDALVGKRSFTAGAAKFSPQPKGKPGAARAEAETGGGGGSGKGGGLNGGGGGSGGGGEGSASSGGGGGGILGLWATYLALLDSQPVATKAATSAVLNAAGDLLSQKYCEGNTTVDWRRLGTFTFLGAVLVGPALHFWYGALARAIPAAGTSGAMRRLAGDQLVFAPAFIAVFFSALLTLEGHAGDVPAKLRQDWRGAVVANWKLWVPFQFLNFRFVPQQLQVLAANMVAVVWNTYLSYATHRKLA